MKPSTKTKVTTGAAVAAVAGLALATITSRQAPSGPPSAVLRFFPGTDRPPVIRSFRPKTDEPGDLVLRDLGVYVGSGIRITIEPVADEDSPKADQ